jgi:hypothetical protein
MASNTAITERRRKVKRRGQGKADKRANRKGTTPPFPIHKEKAK